MNRPKTAISTLILPALLFVALEAGTEDWPTYMHDAARSGVSRDEVILEELNPGWVYHSPAPPKRAWSDGPPWDALSESGSVPMRDFDTAFFVTIAGENLYFGSSVTNCIHCLDVSSGRQNWFYRTDGPVRFPPSYESGKLYFGSDDGYVYCLNALSGALIWKYSPSGDERFVVNNGNFISMWPVRTGTAVFDGRVYFAASLVPWQPTYLCALDAQTGSDSGPGLYCTSGGIAPNGAVLVSRDNVYIPQGRYYPHVFDRLTGKSRGTLSGSAGTFAILTSDDADPGIVYGGGKFFSDMGGWQLKANKDKIASYPNGKCLIVTEDTSYVITETFKIEPTEGYKYDYVTKLRALDRSKRGASRWQKDFICDTRRFAVIYAGGTLFSGGIGKVEAHDTRNGSVVWSAKVNGRARGLAAAGGRLFVSTDIGEIYMFGPK